MPRIEASLTVPVSCDLAFALSQTYGEVRYQWDPFVKEQRLLDDAPRAAKGVQTWTRSRHGLVMVSEYVSFQPPSHVGMKMVKGPWFFASFSGGWNFKTLDSGRTEATWRYNFTIRPKWLRAVADPVGKWLLNRDIARRLDAFARACTDESIVAQVVLASPTAEAVDRVFGK